MCPQAVEEYLYVGEVAAALALALAWQLHRALHRLCKSLHEERYLVGRQLSNLGDAE